MIIVGIDPGIKNSGITITEFTSPEDFKVLDSLVLPIKEVIDYLEQKEFSKIVIERFVQYGLTANVDYEIINREIGKLEYFSEKIKKVQLLMPRAIDWQVDILKYFKQMDKLKKFNARKFCKEQFNLTFKTEHEADAFLLSYFGHMKFK